MDIEALARNYGYPAVLLGTALQGEVVLLVCGYLAHQGYLSVWLVWLIAALGGTTGDQAYFFLGRYYGTRVIERLPSSLRRSAGWARALVDRNPKKVLLYTRFLLGMRVLLPLLAGTSSIRSATFVRYNMATAAVWSAIFVAIGYAYGTAAQQILKQYEGYEFAVILVLVLLGLIYHWISHRLRSRWQRDDDA